MNDQTLAEIEPGDAHDPIVSLRMPTALIEKIDEARGKASRSAFIRAAIEKQTKKRKTQ